MRMLVASLVLTAILASAASAQQCRQLTFGMSIERAVWAPDGSSIAFDSDQSIYTIPPDGGTPTLVVASGESPSWSSDSQRIVFAERGSRQIFWQDVAGGSPHQVTPEGNNFWNFWPDWSHDGDKIVCCSSRSRMASATDAGILPGRR